MKNLTSLYRKVELFFGNMKFAVVIILIFATALGYGTFMESYHGTEFANRLIYKSYPFMMVQFAMFLSILFATLIRLPAKKHLYGFYTIHAGLIILFIGSYITYQSGVDGTLTLVPNLPARQVQVNQDQFKIQFPSQGKEVTVDLPYGAFPKNLKMEYEGIRLKTFLPFAEDKLNWITTKKKDPFQASSRYRLYNDNFGEFVTVTLHPLSDFNNTLKMGLLNIHYMPSSLAHCFGDKSSEGLIIWNGETGECMGLNSQDLKKRKALTGKTLIDVKFNNEMISFLPEMSPLPLDPQMELNERSPYRIFSKKLFENSPHLFLFGEEAAWFDKESKNWILKPTVLNQDTVLPWMGFKIKLLENRQDAYPSMTPNYVKPVQENGQTIVGEMKAIEVEVEGQTFWVKSGDPVAFTKGDERINFELAKKTLPLPYEIILDQFKMDTDPGTQTPASFESFVTLFKGNEGSTKHHVFMNNPLKHENFTFYQASYFQTQEGPFGSILSVNFDPGRFWKYLGSLLLVLGSIWHYFLRRKHLAKPVSEKTHA